MKKNIILDSHIKDPFDDLLLSFKLYKFIFNLSLVDIKNRYKRTFLGPFWITLSMAIFVFALGFVFSVVWNLDIQTYLPFVVTGFMCWIPFSTMITDGTNCFINSSNITTQIRYPFTFFALVSVTRNFLIMLHHFIIYFLVLFVFPVKIGYEQFLFFIGITLFLLNGIWISIFLGMFAAKFRDTNQILISLLQISMFITPIFWPPEQLASRGGVGQLIVDINILHHFIDIMRSPLLGKVPDLLSYIVVIIFTFVGGVFTYFYFKSNREKIIFWIM